MTEYSAFSPYFKTEFTGTYLGPWNPRSITREADDIVYEITKQYENRPDLLARDLYGDERLWWVFAVRNPNIIKDPIFDFSEGKKIFIPKKNNIESDLGL